MLQRVLLIASAIIILIGVSGCMWKKNEPSVKEQVEKYMKDKYNEEFKVLGGGTEGWNDPNEEIYVKSEKFPDEMILIRRGKKSGEMIDNYMDFLMKSKIEEVMNGIVSEIYPKSKVFFNTDGPPHAGATPQMSVEEYLEYLSKYRSLSLIICINDPNYKANKDEKLEQLRLRFEEKQYISDLTMYYILDGKADLINSDNWREVLNGPSAREWWALRGDFLMDKSYKFHYSEWREVK